MRHYISEEQKKITRDAIYPLMENIARVEADKETWTAEDFRSRLRDFDFKGQLTDSDTRPLFHVAAQQEESRFKGASLTPVTEDMPDGIRLACIVSGTAPRELFVRDFPPVMERRYGAGRVILRQTENSGTVLVGMAAVFDSPFEGFGFTEIIAPGAFTRALKEKQDVRALVNHDPSLILGRTKADTLTLAETKEGLHAEIRVADTQTGRDTTESVRRGDLDGMSFGFSVVEEIWRTVDEVEIRRITDVDLFDVSVVTFPAFEETSVGLRSYLAEQCGVPVHEFRGNVLRDPTVVEAVRSVLRRRSGRPKGDFAYELESLKDRMRLAASEI